MNSLKLILVIFCSLYLCFSCKSKKRSKKDLGNMWVYANFLHDSIIDGEAKYYDKSGNLLAINNFKKGIREGAALQFFPNGKLSDSLTLINGVEHGYDYSYQYNGDIKWKQFYYHGLKVGDRYYYTDNIVRKYIYQDFNRQIIAECAFDSLGKCLKIQYTCNPAMIDVIRDDNKSILNIFAYLPRPDMFEVEHRLCLIDNKNKIQGQSVINPGKPFLDTSLNYPEQGWKYAIYSYVNRPKDSLYKLFIDELRIE